MTTLATLVVSLVGDVGGFVDSMEKAEKQAASTGGGISKAFGGAAHAIGGFAKIAAGAAVAGIGVLTAAGLGGIKAVNDWANELDSLGDVLGTNADESAALAVAIRTVGGDVQGITGQMSRLVQGLRDSKGGLGETGKVMKSLGIAFEDANGNLLPTTTILESVANKIADMPDGLEKTRLMVDLFGKSGKDLSDTMNALADGGLTAAEEKARALGLAIGDKGVEQSIAFEKSMRTMEMALQGVFVQIGTQLLPILTPLLEKFGQWATEAIPVLVAGFQQVVGWIQTNLAPAFNQVITILQTVIAWVQANWPQISGQISGAFAQADAALRPIIEAIRTIITTVFGVISKFLKEHGEEIKAFLQNAWRTISDIVSGIVQIIRTVLESVFGGIAKFVQENQEGIKALIESVWNAIKAVVETVLNLIRGIVNTVLAILKGDWQTAWETIKHTVEQVWEGIKNFIKAALDTIKNILSLAWNAIKDEVSRVWTAIRTAIENAFNQAIDFLRSIPERLVAIGRDMIMGVVRGIESAAGAIWDAIRRAIEDALARIGDFLGLGSPSRLMAEMGQDMMTGLAMGIMQGANLPQLALNAAVGNIGSGEFSGSARGDTVNNTTINFNTTAPLDATRDAATIRALAGAF